MSKVVDSTNTKQTFFQQGEIRFFNGSKSQVIVSYKIYTK